jgi:arabinose-5-phosphate isomerase
MLASTAEAQSSDGTTSPMNIRRRIAEIMAAEAAAILAVRVTADFEQAVLALCDSRGKVLTTGLGKAGHVTRKLASTLCSTGTPASHPTGAVGLDVVR